MAFNRTVASEQEWEVNPLKLHQVTVSAYVYMYNCNCTTSYSYRSNPTTTDIIRKQSNV